MRRILVRLPNWLGDAMMARPLLASVRASFRDASITAVGPRTLLELLATDASWDEAMPWPLPAGGMGRLRSPRAFAALVLPPSFSSAWFAFRTGAALRAGFAHEGRSWLLTHAERRRARGDLHLSREYLALGRAVGAAEGAPPGPLAPTPAGRDEARALLGADTRPVAVLGPGATYGPAKRWSAERFAEVGRRFAARGWRVLACGAAAEAGACEEVARECGGESFAGRTSLEGLAAICAGAAAAVCNDSGLAHLAAAAGAPTVAVFGSTSSAWTAPLGARAAVAQRPPVCSPCFARTCRIGYRCLVAVSPDEVLAAVDRVAAPGGRVA